MLRAIRALLLTGCALCTLLGCAPAPAAPATVAATPVPAAAATTANTPAAAVTPANSPAAAGVPGQLLLATTTSTADTGLLAAILPLFERQYSAKVKVVAVGTGQALKLGADGNADVELVHARAQEDAFVAAGDGIDRRDVMYNDFIIVGPPNDPAQLKGATVAGAAFKKIADAQAPFASRGDNSGTNTKELDIWKSAGLKPAGAWYMAIGQGMGETLTFANEKGAYTLSDRGTYLAQKARLNLVVWVGGAKLEQNSDPSLLNPYGVIPVNPAKHPNVNHGLAEQFAQWITALDTQQAIMLYGVDKFGQSLFRPSSAQWKVAHP